MTVSKFVIERLSPNTGRVWEIGILGTKRPVSAEMDYIKCRQFLEAHREERLTIYRIAYISGRKNAKRHLKTNLYAEDLRHALHEFDQIDILDKTTYQLLTGDWQLLAEKKPGDDHIILFKEAENG